MKEKNKVWVASLVQTLTLKENDEEVGHNGKYPVKTKEIRYLELKESVWKDGAPT